MKLAARAKGRKNSGEVSGTPLPSPPPQGRRGRVVRGAIPCPDPRALLAWYDRHARVLPWRARGGARTEPYRVWLSEIMLQQTTVKAVAPYYARFLAQWPT